MDWENVFLLSGEERVDGMDKNLHFSIIFFFFFVQGNSNSLASIDLNAGYVGLQNFNFVTVGVYLTLNTFNGLILTYLILLYNIFDVQKNDRSKR